MSKKVIEFRFDADTESRIRALVDALGGRLPSPPTKLVRQPHVSLAVFDEADDGPLLRAAENLAARCRWRMPTRLAGVGAFPGEQRAIFLLPTQTGAMSVRHAMLHEELGAAAGGCWPYYRPGQWVPHCTLATGVPAGSVGAALELARTTFAFGPATLASLVVLELDPDRELATFAFEPPPTVSPDDAAAAGMPTLDVRPGLRLRPARVEDAAELFAVVDANRAHLRRWLPWVDATRGVADEAGFLRAVAGRAWLAELDGRIAGVCGFNSVAQGWNRSCEIGYWLTADAQGRGVMTACVRRLIEHAFDAIGINRVSIPVAQGNARSRAVCERLGFRAEGVARDAEWLYGKPVDHVVYARLATDGPLPV